MKELSLFSGGGGSVLAGKLLGWRTIGYVENNEYCQKIIRQRIEDGIFDNAPIFGDIRAFNSAGFAGSYSGMVGVITAGFPCPPFSLVGKRLGEKDPRNMWPETIETIRKVQPKFAFLENVPGIISSGYLDKIFSDLVESGYDCRWCVLSAAEVGAPHKRERLWIVAHRIDKGLEGHSRNGAGVFRQVRKISEQGGSISPNGLRSGKGDAAHSKEHGWNPRGEDNSEKGETGREFDRGYFEGNVPNATSTGRHAQQKRDQKSELFAKCSWWESEPSICRVVNGMANRAHRLRALGNGWVPAVAATAWHILTEDLL